MDALWLLLLMTVVILSESFDSLSLSNILILKRELRAKGEEATSAKAEAEQLRQKFTSVVASFMNVQQQILNQKIVAGTPQVKEPDTTDPEQTPPPAPASPIHSDDPNIEDANA